METPVHDFACIWLGYGKLAGVVQGDRKPVQISFLFFN
jgi:hypothetical protein